MNMVLQMDRAGNRATLKVKPLSGSCSAVVVHLPAGGTRQIVPAKGDTITFSVARNS